MRLSDIIVPAAIAVGVRVSDKTDALRVASDRLGARSGLDARRIQEALAAREALGSTGIGSGVALPHVCFQELTRSYACFFTLAGPIDFDSIDQQPVDLICAIISPTSSGCGEDKPLSYLAAAARILRDKKKSDALRKAKSAWMIYDIVKSTEAAGHLVS
jgi:PTS system nitrogen regulatory IIA component